MEKIVFRNMVRRTGFDVIMKISFLTFLVMTKISRAQESDSSGYKNLDTIKFYKASLVGPGYGLSSSSDSCWYQRDSAQVKVYGSYFLNCVEISKDSFYYYKEINERIFDCKPCVIQYYTIEEQLLSTIVQYTDVRVGDIITYYPSGKIQFAGHYKENHTEKWGKYFRKGYGGLRDGEWKYYSEEGELIKIETYSNGELIKTENFINGELVPN